MLDNGYQNATFQATLNKKLIGPNRDRGMRERLKQLTYNDGVHLAIKTSFDILGLGFIPPVL